MTPSSDYQQHDRSAQVAIHFLRQGSEFREIYCTTAKRDAKEPSEGHVHSAGTSATAGAHGKF